MIKKFLIVFIPFSFGTTILFSLDPRIAVGVILVAMGVGNALNYDIQSLRKNK